MRIFMPSPKPSNESFSSLLPKFHNDYVKVGSNRALNGWDLSTQHVNLTIASFLEVPIQTFVHTIILSFT